MEREVEVFCWRCNMSRRIRGSYDISTFVIHFERTPIRYSVSIFRFLHWIIMVQLELVSNFSNVIWKILHHFSSVSHFWKLWITLKLIILIILWILTQFIVSFVSILWSILKRTNFLVIDEILIWIWEVLICPIFNNWLKLWALTFHNRIVLIMRLP